MKNSPVDIFCIFCADYLFIIVFLMAAIYFFRQPRKIQIQIVIYGIICAALSYGAALIAGMLYYDPRPFVVGHFKPLIAHDSENGFPSDHVLMLSVIAAVFFIYNKTVSIILWLLIFLVAYARIYVGVHHFVDVLASMLIVIVISYLTILVLNKGMLQLITLRVNILLRRVGLGYIEVEM